MTQNQRPQHSNNKQNPISTEEQLSKFLELQKLKLTNEAKDLALKEKDMEYQSKYAHKLLEMQGSLEKDRPREHRKTITRFAYIVFALIVLLMIFSGFCIYYNKEDFLYSLFKGAGYLVTTLAGYYFGRKTNNQENKHSESSVEEIKD